MWNWLKSFWNLFLKKDFAITTKGLIVKIEDTSLEDTIVVSFGSFNGAKKWVAKKTISLFTTDIDKKITAREAGKLLKEKVVKK